jgi:hypothetical protein
VNIRASYEYPVTDCYYLEKVKPGYALLDVEEHATIGAEIAVHCTTILLIEFRVRLAISSCGCGGIWRRWELLIGISEVGHG